jgi:NADPH-dependent glutamate synthase beta subunit-like oxidoreductase/CO/xanthine dehydrogenase FAD-binding subunit
MKSLMKYKHINATTIEQAVTALRQYAGNACVLSGGTDILGTMRFDILRTYPEAIINLKTIAGLDYIKQEDGMLKIGALTRLQDIATNSTVKSKYVALAEAARTTASPHIREMGTIAGNICQLNRCWYFRKEENRFDCLRKGGQMCYAIVGENRYHSIFGATRVVTPPCATECPAGVDIPSYLSKIRDNDLVGAAKILLNRNPLPAITGRVCPHFCEQACNRNEFDEATSTRAIERFMGDYILKNSSKLIKAPKIDTGKKVAIVGAGPAGLSAAYYLRQSGHQVTVFDRMKEPGGMLSYAIPSYRLPKDIVTKQVKVLESIGIEFKLGVNIGKDITLEKLKKNFDSIFIACGTWVQGAIGIEGEELLLPGLEFLKNVRLGKREVPKRILVIGGGNVAIDVATVALRLGAKEVIVVSLESREEMPAFKAEIETAIAVGVKLMPSWGPYKILETKGNISGMELVKCTSVFNKVGKFAPTYDNKVKTTIDADQIILATGQRADLSFIGSNNSLKVERGLISIDRDTQATSIPGMFAGGDITTGSASVSASMAAGRRAADSINQYLGGTKISFNAPDTDSVPLKFNYSCLQKSNPVEPPELPVAERIQSIDVEDVSTLDLSAISTEANRCFNCGCLAVNPSDLAPALVALDARIVTSKRSISAEEFWAVNQGIKSTVLENDEIVTEIQIPKPAAGVKSAFIKFALRKSIDFPITNCAVAVGKGTARICLNAVFSKPYRATKAEAAIKGKTINVASAEAAGSAAVTDAIGLTYNRYKIQIAKALVKRVILACK